MYVLRTAVLRKLFEIADSHTNTVINLTRFPTGQDGVENRDKACSVLVNSLIFSISGCMLFQNLFQKILYLKQKKISWGSGFDFLRITYNSGGSGLSDKGGPGLKKGLFSTPRPQLSLINNFLVLSFDLLVSC